MKTDVEVTGADECGNPFGKKPDYNGSAEENTDPVWSVKISNVIF